MPSTASQVKEAFAVERVVAFILTPGLLVVSPWFVKLMASWYPGVHLSPAAVSHVIVVVLAGIVLTTMTWLHGRQIPALLHTPASVLAAVQSNPTLLAAVASEVGKLGALPPAPVPGPPAGSDVPSDGSTAFADDTPPPSDFAPAASSAPLSQS